MSFLGIGAGAEREVERKTRQAQDRANKKQWRYTRNQIEAQNAYARDSLKIQIENDETIRQFNIDNLNRDRDYIISQQDFEFAQAERVFQSQSQKYEQQKQFNEIAYNQAIRQQERYLGETLVGMEFDKAQTLLNFNTAVAGNELKRATAKETADIKLGQLQDSSYLAMEAAKSKTAFGKRQANLEALKASGQAAIRGQAGVSAGKVQQGIKAEVGAAKAQMSKELFLQQRETMVNMVYNQRSIVNQLLSTEAEIDLDLANLNYQLDLDQAKMAINRQNLMVNDKLIRDRIALQRKQADMNNIEPIPPSKVPEPPAIVEPPVLKYQEAYQQQVPEEPEKGVKGLAAYTDWGQIAQDGIQVATMLVGGISAGAGTASTGGFHWGNFAKGLVGLPTTNYSAIGSSSDIFNLNLTTPFTSVNPQNMPSYISTSPSFVNDFYNPSFTDYLYND